MMNNLRADVGSFAPLQGVVSMTVRDAETGEKLFSYRRKNTIVYNGLNAVMQLLAQNVAAPAPATLQIASLRVGTGTVAPTRPDVALVAQVFSMALVSADRVVSTATSSMTITKTLGAGDANGNTLTECGLFLADGSMFARQIHSAVSKTALITITYEWQLSFTS